MPTAASTVNAANSIGIQEFLKILSSQLNNQDPLKPLDNQEFLSQIAQFSALQQSQQLNQKVDQLLTSQSSVQAVGLLGKRINFSLADGTKASGRVSELTFPNGVPTFSAIDTVFGRTFENITVPQITLIKEN